MRLTDGRTDGRPAGWRHFTHMLIGRLLQSKVDIKKLSLRLSRQGISVGNGGNAPGTGVEKKKSEHRTWIMTNLLLSQQVLVHYCNPDALCDPTENFVHV